MRLAVDPEVYAVVTRLVNEAAEDVKSALENLDKTLAGLGGMAGSDNTGATFSGGRGGLGGYDGAAGDLSTVITELIRRAFDIGGRVDTAGYNYDQANRSSTAKEPVSLMAPPVSLVAPQAPTFPSAHGGGGSEVPGWLGKAWSFVEGASGYVWPDGDPGKLGDAASAWGDTSGTITTSAADLQGAGSRLSSQEAPDVEPATAHVDDVKSRLSTLAGACTGVGASCSDVGAAIADAHSQLIATLIQFAVELPWLLGDLFGDWGHLRERIAHYAGICARIIEALIQRAQDAGKAAFNAGGQVAGLLAPYSAPAPAPVQIPPPGTSTEDVNRWWTSLTQDQRDQLIAEHPPALGKLLGVPVEDRSTVNVAVMHDDLDRVRHAHGVVLDKDGNVPEDVLKNPWKYGLLASDIERYNIAIKADAGLKQQEAGIPHGESDRGDPLKHAYLLTYDPMAFGGKGRVAIALGDPDKAKNTAVIVPGMTTSIQDDWLARNDGIELYNESVRADPSNPTAVVMWMGYDAPDADPQHFATPELARAGAGLLASDVNSFAVTHQADTPQHLTVIGHSYGSTTTADAVYQGMHADDVVLIGSPGTDQMPNAQAFLDRGTNIYVGSASSDPVTLIGEGTGVWGPLNDSAGNPLNHPGLGNDPAQADFGGIRFRAEVAGHGLPSINDHLEEESYFVRGSESVYAMADIVSDHGDRLGDEGALAAPRSGKIPIVGDPEWGRGPEVTNEHHHVQAHP